MAQIGSNVTLYTTEMFEFERKFDTDAFLDWNVHNWTLSFWYAAFYVLVIFSAKYYMASRPRFELRVPLIIWSGLLAAFSIAGAARTVPEAVYILRHQGWSHSLCSSSYFNGPTAFWAYTFVISKAYELGDTVFIVFRKQPLVFLHWYHHITVMIYVWYSYSDHTAPGRWFCFMNYTVHSFMYTYYTVRALRIQVPKFINIFVTSIQIMQMMMGLVINISTYVYKSRGLYCQQSYENMRYSFLMYLSYFFLFCHFFYKSYLKPKGAAMKTGLAKSSYANRIGNGTTHGIVGGEIVQNGVKKLK